MTRAISRRIKISQSPEKIYRSLLKPSAITQWWEAATAIIIEDVGGIYAISWGADIDEPDFTTVSKILEMVPNEKLSMAYVSYTSKFGEMPFKAEMEVQFKISKIDSTGSELEVVQSGFPVEKIADDYYNGCISGWENVLVGIKNFCESL